MAHVPHTLVDPVSLASLGAVSTNSLVPAQQPTSLPQLRAKDAYQQRCLKCSELCTFYSYPALLRAALFEGDAAVTTFIPRPFNLRVNGCSYTPSIYVVRADQRQVIDLTLDGTLPDEQRRPLAAFFTQHGLGFEVQSHKALLAREAEAQHWLMILRALVVTQHLSTETQEFQLWQQCQTLTDITVGDILDVGNRTQHYLKELAFYRLLYRHRLRVDPSQTPLTLDTPVTLCT
ncbi:hypothetical protein [Pseudoteredinibacter isoporae]|uniref:hypothetical protein n=1 Tax=Pseudoteredinibacter isoporae TaxID=570281 RepID=UPI003101CB65